VEDLQSPFDFLGEVVAMNVNAMKSGRRRISMGWVNSNKAIPSDHVRNRQKTSRAANTTRAVW